MAEHGAHLTSGGIDNNNRPSVFEVLAQQNLSSTIKPAIRHALKVFAEKYPEKLGCVLHYYHEIFLLFDTLVQSYYLKKYEGSFAEHFYELKRAPSHNPKLMSLSQKLRLQSVACLVLIPYVQQKLDSLYEALRYQEGPNHGTLSFLQQHLNLRQRLVRLYLSIYPYVHTAWESITLAYTLSYMLRSGRWHSLSMHLSGTELQRCSLDDDFSTTDVSNPNWSNLSMASKLSLLVTMLLNSTTACLSTSLSVGVFFLQFLEWWYASDASAKSLIALPIPPPPQQEKLKEINPSMCPLCLQSRTNSTALAVSGYVFCYPCIAEHVMKEKCCPVSGYPASIEHLVKIYEQDV